MENLVFYWIFPSLIMLRVEYLFWKETCDDDDFWRWWMYAVFAVGFIIWPIGLLVLLVGSIIYLSR